MCSSPYNLCRSHTLPFRPTSNPYSPFHSADPPLPVPLPVPLNILFSSDPPRAAPPLRRETAISGRRAVFLSLPSFPHSRASDDGSPSYSPECLQNRPANSVMKLDCHLLPAGTSPSPLGVTHCCGGDGATSPSAVDADSIKQFISVARLASSFFSYVLKPLGATTCMRVFWFFFMRTRLQFLGTIRLKRYRSNSRLPSAPGREDQMEPWHCRMMEDTHGRSNRYLYCLLQMNEVSGAQSISCSCICATRLFHSARQSILQSVPQNGEHCERTSDTRASSMFQSVSAGI